MTIDHGDYTRTLAALVALPALVETLEVELIAATASTEGSRTKPASRPPANPELVSDLEQAWGVLTTWARDWVETYTFTAPMPYWDDVCGFLARHWPNTAETHPAAYEFADEIAGRRSATTTRTETGPVTSQSVWTRLSRHTYDEPKEWQPLPGRWKCPIIHPQREQSCGGEMLEHLAEQIIVCTKCGEKWTYDRYDHLGAMLGMERIVTIGQAALLAKVSPRTIDRWIKENHLPLADDPEGKGRRMVDKCDLVLVTRRVTSA